MKYIRTKDGKVFYLKRFEDETTPFGKSLGIITMVDKSKFYDYYQFFKEDIIKEADTIEELCDLFVVKITLIEDNYAFYRYEGLSEAKLVSFKNNAPLYGAIWTGEGLIYVAKLNEKGEFELL